MKKKSSGGVGKAEVVYGNKQVVSAAKSTKVAKDPYYKKTVGAVAKEVGGSITGKKSGGRLDKPGRSPFSKAAGGATK